MIGLPLLFWISVKSVGPCHMFVPNKIEKKYVN